MAKKSTVVKAMTTPAVLINMELLGKLCEATKAGGFLYLDSTEFAPLVHAGLAETNNTMVNEAGHFATRATEKGIELVNGASPAPAAIAQAPAVAAPASAFVIRDNIPQPPRTRTGGGKGRVTTLPFDLLQPGQSFHVPVSEKRPDPVKSISPSVSSYNAKYAVETGEMETVQIATYQKDAEGKRLKVDGHFVKTGMETVTRAKTKQERTFSISPAAANDPDGPGARIFRLS